MTTITVTQEHIMSGIRGDCTGCPVAFALADAYPNASYISVLERDEGVPEGMLFIGTAEMQAPQEVIDFVNGFDAGRTVKPFSFTLPEMNK